MEKANNEKDFEELAGLGHWLKGSGGTIGFDQLSKPAKKLEDNAKAGDHEACTSDLVEIRSIVDRLRAGTDTGSSAAPANGEPAATR